MDARGGVNGDDAANVIANTIDLQASGGGSIGNRNGTNDLEIDSQHYVLGGTIGLRADDNVYVTETAGDARVVLAEALGPDHSPALRLTVRESAIQGEDLNLLAGGTVLFIENAPESVPQGYIHTPIGSILLRIGDNVFTDPNARIVVFRIPINRDDLIDELRRLQFGVGGDLVR